jgi:hypothetical protein
VISRFPSTVSSSQEGTADFLQNQKDLYFHIVKDGKIKNPCRLEENIQAKRAPKVHLE